GVAAAVAVPVPLREALGRARDLLVPPAVLLLQPEAAHGTEIALDVHAEHLLELLPEVARDQMERLLGHRAVLDRVERLRRLEPTLEPLDERALPRADRAHQVEDLPALLALQRRGVEVAGGLRDGLLDPGALVTEEL